MDQKEYRKQALIDKIRQLYPPDSEFSDTAAIGEYLLKKAIRVTDFTWEDYPPQVIEELFALCIQWGNRHHPDRVPPGSPR